MEKTIKKKSEDPFIFTKKTAFMQRISDVVRTHKAYITGQISVEKTAAFAGKLDEFYGWSDDKVTAFRQRQAGFSSARLLFFYQDGSSNLTWFLFVTEGKWVHRDAGREKWLDPKKDRISLTGYELVRHTRPGKADPSWTWRYSSQRYEDIRQIIVLAIRRNRDDELRQWIKTVWSSPAFAGVREQVKKIASLIKSDWKRSRGNDPLPEIPKGLGYVRRLADKGTLLSNLKSKDS